jgi:hypothetical protein
MVVALSTTDLFAEPADVLIDTGCSSAAVMFSS